MTERHGEQLPGYRDAVWVSRCVGRAESSPLRPHDVEGLAHVLRLRTLMTGETLHRPGEPPEGVFIVRDGRLELSVPGLPGHAVIQTLGPGDVDGDIQLLLDLVMPYESRAGVATSILVVPREEFGRLLATHPGLAHRWLTSVSQRLARSHSRLTGLLGQTLEVQVALLLLEESVEDVVGLSQATLAAMLGARRPSVNKVLRSFEGRGWVELGYRTVKIRDRASLDSIVNRPPGRGTRPAVGPSG